MKRVGMGFRGAMALFVVAALMPPGVGRSTDRSQARSMVLSRYGIVAAESPLAAQAGANILARGGSAIDAAIAANAVMGVVAPMMCGVGGDLFAMVYDAKTGKLCGLNASGWAPAALTLEFLRNKGLMEMPELGIHSVTVPGTVDGWTKLVERFGRLGMEKDLAAAIRTADEGFPVTELFAADWAAAEARLRAESNTARTYLLGDHTPRVGEVFRNGDLARSLREVALGGRDAFYRGEIARRILDYSRRQGGTMTAGDLADFSGEWVEPISTTYRGWTVFELPPNGQGLAALEMLNLMENFPLAEWGHNSARTLHVMIETKKLAYADLLRYDADPKFSDVPVSGLIAKDYARERARLIDLAKARCDVPPGQPSSRGGDTTYLAVVDCEGSMVSLIQSNYAHFGSGLVADGTGFALQNRGALFSLDPNSPNVLAGHKRPLHTIIPAFMTKGDLRIAFGIMGGFNQAQAHAQFVANVVDFGMNIQSALEAARFTKITFAGCDVQMEDRIPAAVRAELEAKGHHVTARGPFSTNMGGGQAVLRNFSTGVNYGASDPRKDGAAIAEPLPQE